MQNLKTRTSGHQMCPPGGTLLWSTATQKMWARLACSRGGASPVEFPDRGPRELDKHGLC